MAELTINTADISAAIKKNLEGFTPDVSLTQVGRVLEVGDGIARVSGLPDAAVNELLEFESGLLGLALNLDEESIGAVVLGEVDSIEEGQSVKATGNILSVPVGDGLLGRVVNTLGEPIDGKKLGAAWDPTKLDPRLFRAIRIFAKISVEKGGGLSLVLHLPSHFKPKCVCR